MTKTEPVELADLRPRNEVVRVSDEQSIRIYGISTKDILALFERFPPLQGLAVGRGITTADIIKVGPDAIAAICAAATHSLNNKKAEAAASILPMETQIEIIEAAGRCTFTNGFGPFVQRVLGHIGLISEEVGKVRGSNSQKPSPHSAEQPTNPSGT
jgi:hypothetical protein